MLLDFFLAFLSVIMQPRGILKFQYACLNLDPGHKVKQYTRGHAIPHTRFKNNYMRTYTLKHLPSLSLQLFTPCNRAILHC